MSRGMLHILEWSVHIDGKMAFYHVTLIIATIV